MTYRSGEPSRKFVEHTVLAHHKEQNIHKKWSLELLMFNCPLYSWGNCLYDLPFISNVLVWNGGWSFRYWLSLPGRNVLSTLMTPLIIYYRCSITSGLKWLDREALAKTICPTMQLWCNFLCISLHWQPLKVRVIFSCCYNGKHFSMTPLHRESERFFIWL